jgi:hypothetical protein
MLIEKGVCSRQIARRDIEKILLRNKLHVRSCHDSNTEKPDGCDVNDGDPCADIVGH